MKKLALTCLSLLAAMQWIYRASAAEYDKYVWETPRATHIDATKTAAMIEELRFQVQQILDAGPLAPLRSAYADIPFEAYFLYYERGREIATVAYAYPHVSKEQQDGIRKYVANLLKEPAQQPWTPGILKQGEGAERRLNKTPVNEGRYVNYDKKAIPTLHVLYGLWLYGDRSGDWDLIKQNWPQIRDYYLKTAQTEVFLYGQMSAHVAMARLAKRFGDEATQKSAESALAHDLDVGKDSAQMEARQKKTRYARCYDPRGVWAFAGQPWMFLDASPEIMRFVADNVKADAIKRIKAMEEVYSLWWLNQPPYFTRWTGDEGVGPAADIFGMCYPVERWVMGTPAEKLSLYMRSVPTGIGDCYWIESLVQTIEAQGEMSWEKL